jgi:hypothetical protein
LLPWGCVPTDKSTMPELMMRRHGAFGVSAVPPPSLGVPSIFALVPILEKGLDNSSMFG